MAFLKALWSRFGAGGTPKTSVGVAPLQQAPSAPGATALAWREKGNAALQKWDLDQAADCYSRAVLADPADPLGWLNRGFVALEKGDARNATDFLNEALARHRQGDAFIADAQFLLGRALRLQGRNDQARVAFEAAVAAKPHFPEAIREALDFAHIEQRHQDALGWAQRLVQVDPSVASRLTLSRSLFELRRHDEALLVLQELIAQDPRLADAWTGVGTVLMALGRGNEALDAFRKVLALAGPTPSALMGEALGLFSSGSQEEALAKLTKLRASHAADLQMTTRLMSMLAELRRPAEVLELGRDVLRHHPDSAEVRWIMSNAHLLLGEFEQGWREYEWRWRAESGTRSGFLDDHGRPRWTGSSDISHQTILVMPEQGLGDCIQFLRYVPELAARAKTVLLVLTKELYPLASVSPWPSNCILAPSGAEIAGFDSHVALMSLPLALQQPQPTGTAVPYLRADRQRAQHWKDRLAGLGPRKFNVGLVWSGNPDHKNDRNRSIPLRLLRSLDTAACRFVSLQPFVRPGDRPAMDEWTGLLRWGEELRDFLDTASLMEALDLIVCVDTSVIHLAGALGRPARALLPYSPDWRWLLHREDTPWYPTVRLCRQEVAGDWTSTLQKLRTELERLAAAA